MGNYKYVSLLVITKPTLAANARGEGAGGNTQTLQHISAGGQDFTVINGYSLRYSSREQWQDMGITTWRKVTSDGFRYGPGNAIQMVDAVPDNPMQYPDIALMGCMIAASGSGENAKAQVRSNVSFSPAISATPYTGDMGFAQGHKAKKKTSKEGSLLNPFNFERHLTRYVYTVTVNLSEVGKHAPNMIRPLLQNLRGLSVGGNHAANHSELLPEVIAYRFYNVRGQSGMFIGTHITSSWAPSKAMDLSAVKEHFTDLGILDEVTFLGQSVSETTISDGLAALEQEIHTMLVKS